MRNGSTAANMLGRGAVAGVAGTVVMTAFQKFVEMPVTGRLDSCAPADFAEKVFRLAPGTPAARWRLNNATHLALGTMWGAAYAFAARAGLSTTAALRVRRLGLCSGSVGLGLGGVVSSGTSSGRRGPRVGGAR